MRLRTGLVLIWHSYCPLSDFCTQTTFHNRYLTLQNSNFAK